MIIQRLFSSKEQKARRKKFDLQVAKDSGRINPKEYFDPAARRQGRKELKLRGTQEELYIRNVDPSKTDPGNINLKLRNKRITENDPRNNMERAGNIYGRGNRVSSKAKEFNNKLIKNANREQKKFIAKGIGKGALITGGAIAAGIGAKKLVDKKKAKKESDKKD